MLLKLSPFLLLAAKVVGATLLFLTAAAVSALPAVADDTKQMAFAPSLATTTTTTTNATTSMSALSVKHGKLVDAHGKDVLLRGVNIGGLFMTENWMTPTNASDYTTLLTTLNHRFGTDKQEELMRTYQQAWFGSSDAQKIKDANMNVIRVPIHWANFVRLGHGSDPRKGWRRDAFAELDRVITAARRAGIYVILDMHGAFGGLSPSQSSGTRGKSQYWTNKQDRVHTRWLWQRIASHYKGDPVIVGFDILNEPFSRYYDVNHIKVNQEYDNLYKAIRDKDPTRIIIMEDTYWTWQAFEVDAPQIHGWTNTMHESHPYGIHSSDISRTIIDTQVAYAKSTTALGVPYYIGEFTGHADPAMFEYAQRAFNNQHIHWTFWSYKTVSSAGTNWGYYRAKERGRPPIPNIRADSYEEIQRKWSRWTTDAAFVRNTKLKIV